MRHIIPLCLWFALCLALLLCACSAEPPVPYASSDNLYYTTLVRPTPSTGTTSTFQIRKTGTLDITFDNTEGTDSVTLTLHKKGFFNWSAPRDMGEHGKITIPAGEILSIHLDKGALSAGKYRFEGCQADGQALYAISVQETLTQD